MTTFDISILVIIGICCIPVIMKEYNEHTCRKKGHKNRRAAWYDVCERCGKIN